MALSLPALDYGRAPALDPDATDPEAMGRPRDCNSGGGRNNPSLTLLEWLVGHVTKRSAALTGALVIHSHQFEEAAAALQLTVDTVRREFSQMHRRGTVEILDRSGGDARFRVTEAGVDLWAEITSARK